MIFFQLIIPEQLGMLSLRAGTRGWFKGSFIKDEYLAVARQSQAGDGEPFFAPGSERLFDHWSFVNGTSKDKLVPWVAVKSGFGVALAGRKISRSALASWSTEGVPADLLEGPIIVLCCIEPVEGHEARVYLLLVTDEKVIQGKVQTVTSEPHLPARLDGLRPMEALQVKRLAIVGVGSGGSMAALNLASAGAGTLHLFDKDELTTDNIFRHACGLRHLGRAKVLAMRDLIYSYDLPSAVVPHEQDVVKNASELWAVVSEVDLVLCATDNVASRRLVNYVAVHTATPLVMACTFRNAHIGEIIRVLPGESACYECTRLVLRETGGLESVEENAESASAVRAPYSLMEGESEEAKETANQGTRADVAMVAALQSRIAIVTLLVGEGEPNSLPSNYLAWGGRSEVELSDPFNFERPFSTNWVHIARRADCPVCASLGSSLDREIDEEYQKIMASLQEASSN